MSSMCRAVTARSSSAIRSGSGGSDDTPWPRCGGRSNLRPGGAAVFSHELPYSEGEEDWIRWLPGKRGDPQPWPEKGDRRRTSDGDELELLFRERWFDPLLQQGIFEVRARLWRDGEQVEQEEHAI